MIMLDYTRWHNGTSNACTRNMLINHNAFNMKKIFNYCVYVILCPFKHGLATLTGGLRQDLFFGSGNKQNALIWYSQHACTNE